MSSPFPTESSAGPVSAAGASVSGRSREHEAVLGQVVESIQRYRSFDHAALAYRIAAMEDPQDRLRMVADLDEMAGRDDFRAAVNDSMIFERASAFAAEVDHRVDRLPLAVQPLMQAARNEAGGGVFSAQFMEQVQLLGPQDLGFLAQALELEANVAAAQVVAVADRAALGSTTAYLSPIDNDQERAAAESRASIVALGLRTLADYARSRGAADMSMSVSPSAAREAQAVDPAMARSMTEEASERGAAVPGVYAAQPSSSAPVAGRGMFERRPDGSFVVRVNSYGAREYWSRQQDIEAAVAARVNAPAREVPGMSIDGPGFVR